MRTARLALFALALAACGQPSLPSGAATPQPPVGPAVPWSDYTAGLQSRIDSLAASKNCAGLQAEFDTANANNTITINRTGHGNADLMGYIDAKLRAAGCY